MNNSKTKGIFFTLLVILIIGISGLSFLIYRINSAAKIIQGYKEEVAVSSSDVDIIALKQMIKQVEDEASKIDSYIINNERAIDFISEIEDISYRSGVNLVIQNVDVKDVSEKISVVDSDGNQSKVDTRLYGQLNMKVKVNGEWASVSKFLIMLENIPKKININEMIFSNEIVDNKRVWNVSFDLTGITN